MLQIAIPSPPLGCRAQDLGHGPFHLLLRCPLRARPTERSEHVGDLGPEQLAERRGDGHLQQLTARETGGRLKLVWPIHPAEHALLFVCVQPAGGCGSARDVDHLQSLLKGQPVFQVFQDGDGEVGAFGEAAERGLGRVSQALADAIQRHGELGRGAVLGRRLRPLGGGRCRPLGGGRSAHEQRCNQQRNQPHRFTVRPRSRDRPGSPTRPCA